MELGLVDPSGRVLDGVPDKDINMFLKIGKMLVHVGDLSEEHK